MPVVILEPFIDKRGRFREEVYGRQLHSIEKGADVDRITDAIVPAHSARRIGKGAERGACRQQVSVQGRIFCVISAGRYHLIDPVRKAGTVIQCPPGDEVIATCR